MSSNSLNVNAACFYPKSVRSAEDSFSKLLTKFKKHEDNKWKEDAHITQDEIYRKFITDIESGKLNSLDKICFMASVLKRNVVVYDKDRWYA
jgi:hypothetical protein